MKRIIHWFRRDLRLADNTALSAACREGDAIVPIFVFDPKLLESPDIGAPRVAFLLDALQSLRRNLEERGLPLLLLRGDPALVVPRLANDLGANAVFANRDYSPYGRGRDERVRTALGELGSQWRDFADLLLVEPWECLKGDETPYTVFTPFARRWRQVEKCPPARRPRIKGIELPPELRAATKAVPSLSSLGFSLQADIITGGEQEAAGRLRRFASQRLAHYRSNRDTPSLSGTSGISADLKYGTLSPRQAYAAVAAFLGAEYVDLDPSHPRRTMNRENKQRLEEAGPFATELCWRDFYHSVLFHFPHVLRGSFRKQYANMVWPETRPEIIEAWTEGRTGFPIVDAGMRQLRETGWMHNRLRMITASFLTKILLVDWRVGERVFMQRLVDGDPAANNGGWQWSASTGTDATPYFRIFNPTLQSKKFDPEGEYIRRWVPELTGVEAPLIHEPGRDPSTLARTSYPPPCVDYAARRKEALELFRGAPSSLHPK